MSKHWIMPRLTDNNILNGTTADNDGYCTSPSSALSCYISSTHTKIAQPDLHMYPHNPLPWLLRFTWLIEFVSVAVLLVLGFEVFCPRAVWVPYDMSLFTFSSYRFSCSQSFDPNMHSLSLSLSLFHTHLLSLSLSELNAIASRHVISTTKLCKNMETLKLLEKTLDALEQRWW